MKTNGKTCEDRKMPVTMNLCVLISKENQISLIPYPVYLGKNYSHFYVKI